MNKLQVWLSKRGGWFEWVLSYIGFGFTIWVLSSWLDPNMDRFLGGLIGSLLFWCWFMLLSGLMSRLRKRRMKSEAQQELTDKY